MTSTITARSQQAGCAAGVSRQATPGVSTADKASGAGPDGKPGRPGRQRLLWRLCNTALILASLLQLGCANIIASQTNKAAERLNTAILHHPDPATVRDALPTLLIIMDGFTGDKAGSDTLLAAARLYGSYSSAFVLDDPQRQKTLSKISLDYASRGICRHAERYCDIVTMPYPEISELAAGATVADLEALYVLGVSWISYIQSHSADWNIVADLPKVKVLLERCVSLDPGYDYGNGHLYLGALATLLPPALGGHPDEGQQHFEQAIELSHGKFLMAKVEYARRYARLMFDQDLHHRLLTEVLAFHDDPEDLILINTLAREQAAHMLEEEQEYFE